MSPWVLLVVCIAFEILATSLLKASAGFTRPWYGVASMASYWVCFALLSVVLTRIPVGVAYAIWSGVGVVGIALIGWLLFRQSLNPMQIGCIGLVLIGAIGLHLSTRAPVAV